MSQTDPTPTRPLDAAGDDDGGETFTVTLLDVGSKEYGDCILCQAGEDSILIDGSHPGDEQGSFSIPRQLRYLLRQPSGPVRVSLLVVTHVHSDHYGCLPAMVLDGTLTADFALVADPRLGWGEVEGGDEEGGFAAFAAAHPLARRVALALREELPSAGDDQALRELMDVAGTARERYEAMLQRLRDDGATVVCYGANDPAPVLERFRSIDLQILGPSQEQLVTCARIIREALQADLASASAQIGVADMAGGDTDELAVLRSVLAQDSLADAGRLKGAALNNQSIVLQLTVGRHKALLTGDMQLVNSEIPELEAERDALRATIRGNRPYAFFKVPHHASTDSFDAGVLDDVTSQDGSAPLLGISTGTRGDDHPSRRALEVLRSRTDRVTWARTDRNGQVAFRFGPDGGTAVPRRGELNDATPKPSDADLASAALASAAAGDAAPSEAAGAPLVRTDVVTRDGTRVTVTIFEREPATR